MKQSEKEAVMRTVFVDRFGTRQDMELTTSNPCPECCGTIEPIDPQHPDRGMRCTSCGLTFQPRADNQQETAKGTD